MTKKQLDILALYIAYFKPILKGTHKLHIIKAELKKWEASNILLASNEFNYLINKINSITKN